MEAVNWWIARMALLGNGYVYGRTFERKEKKWFRVLPETVGYIVILAIVREVLGGDGMGAQALIWTVGFCFTTYMLFTGRKLELRGAVYYAIWSLMSWQLLDGVWVMVQGKEGFWQNGLAGIISEILLFAVGELIIIFTLSRWIADIGHSKIGPRQLAGATVSFLVFELVALMQEGGGIQKGSMEWKGLHLMQILVAVILYLESELFKKSALQKEIDMMNLLWKKEKEQYLLSKENIALINQKCHDLKHQIRALRGTRSEDMDQYLAEIEESVQIYEAIVKTGNEVLDTILTEKSLYCKERGITISCVADGRLMSFIHTVDLYAILGNAIDNAIEAVEKFKHEEKRQIDVLIYQQQKFLVINIINPMKDTLIYEEELPVTTKKDTNYHGYGLRSIQHLVKKYDGVLTVKEEDGCFSLVMLIPIPET